MSIRSMIPKLSKKNPPTTGHTTAPICAKISKVASTFPYSVGFTKEFESPSSIRLKNTKSIASTNNMSNFAGYHGMMTNERNNNPTRINAFQSAEVPCLSAILPSWYEKRLGILMITPLITTR